MSITATDGVRVITISNNDQTVNVLRAREAAEAAEISASNALDYAERAEAAEEATSSAGLQDAIAQAEAARDDAQGYADDAAADATATAADVVIVSNIKSTIDQIEAVAETGLAGSSATVDYQPDVSPVMTFTIPRGDQGVPGDPGPTGPAGSAFIWKEAVADETALLALPSPEEDEGRVTSDTGNLWLYQDSAWTDTGAPAVGPAGPPGTTEWSGITGKPATFPPSAHNHDTVYAKLTGAAYSGLVSISRAGQAMLEMNNTNSPNADPTTLRESNAGDFVVVHGSDDTLAMTVEASGATITAETAAITKEKGDARYWQLSDAVVRTFETVAAMVASTENTVGDHVRTLGYLAAGDGGGNIYEIVAAATGTVDGGSYINLTGISGQAKGLFDGQVVRVEQFGVPATGDSSAVFTAANTYALALRQATAVNSSVKLAFHGYAELADPITIGGVVNFDVDFSGSFFNVITGGDLESDSDQPAITLLCAQTHVRAGTIDCNLICGGYRVSNGVNTLFEFDRILQFVWRGLTIDTDDGSCAGAVFHKVTGNERASSDDSSTRTATGIYANANDIRIVHAHIGYCLYPIWVADGGNGVEFICCHPFNGGPTEVGGAQHPFALVNENSQRVFCYSCYFDNGYIVDRTGSLKIEGGWNVQLQSTMTDPIVRIFMPADPDDLRGSISNFPVSVGFFEDTNDWNDPAATFVTSMNYTFADMDDKGSKVVDYHGRKTVLFANRSDDDVEIHQVRQGGSTADITHQYSAGTAPRIRVSYGYADGEVRIARTGDGEGKLTLGGTGLVGVESDSGAFLIYSNDTLVARFQANGAFRPEGTNTYSNGISTNRWSDVFTVNLNASGTVNLSGLPTSASGLSSGDVWNDSGTLKIV